MKMQLVYLFIFVYEIYPSIRLGERAKPMLHREKLLPTERYLAHFHLAHPRIVIGLEIIYPLLSVTAARIPRVFILISNLHTTVDHLNRIENMEKLMHVPFVKATLITRVHCARAHECRPHKARWA